MDFSMSAEQSSEDRPVSSMHAGSDAALSSGSLWNMFLTAKLIDLWWERPSLYDSTLDDYKDKLKRNRDISDIASQLFINDQDVRKKMNNLRRQYAREKALLEKSRMNIASTGDGILYESNWLYYPRMAFLDTFVNTKPVGSKPATSDPQVKSEVGHTDSGASDASDDGIPSCKIARQDQATGVGCKPLAASSTLADCSTCSSSPPVDSDEHQMYPCRSGWTASKSEASSSSSPLDPSAPSDTPGPSGRDSPTRLASDASVGEVTPSNRIGTNAVVSIGQMDIDSKLPASSSSVAGAVPVSIMHGKASRKHGALIKKRELVQHVVAKRPSKPVFDVNDSSHHHHEQPECRRCDGDDIFGRFVAHEMRQITDTRLKRLVKFKVHAAIMEAHSSELV